MYCLLYVLQDEAVGENGEHQSEADLLTRNKSSVLSAHAHQHDYLMLHLVSYIHTFEIV